MGRRRILLFAPENNRKMEANDLSDGLETIRHQQWIVVHAVDS